MNRRHLIFTNPHASPEYDAGEPKKKRMTRTKEMFAEARLAQMQRKEEADNNAYEARLAEK